MTPDAQADRIVATAVHLGFPTSVLRCRRGGRRAVEPRHTTVPHDDPVDHLENRVAFVARAATKHAGLQRVEAFERCAGIVEVGLSGATEILPQLQQLTVVPPCLGLEVPAVLAVLGILRRPNSVGLVTVGLGQLAALGDQLGLELADPVLEPSHLRLVPLTSLSDRGERSVGLDRRRAVDDLGHGLDTTVAVVVSQLLEPLGGVEQVLNQVRVTESHELQDDWVGHRLGRLRSVGLRGRRDGRDVDGLLGVVLREERRHPAGVDFGQVGPGLPGVGLRNPQLHLGDEGLQHREGVVGVGVGVEEGLAHHDRQNSLEETLDLLDLPLVERVFLVETHQVEQVAHVLALLLLGLRHVSIIRIDAGALLARLNEQSASVKCKTIDVGVYAARAVALVLLYTHLYRVKVRR